MKATRALVAAGAIAAALTIAAPNTAEAFCGFYVDGAGSKLFANATQVVMMREGTRTVLAMQNNYQGPPADFAMVVPVPVVLQKDDVKTLSRALFDRVDKLAAPRLVEYWEQDPCQTHKYDRRRTKTMKPRRSAGAKEKKSSDKDLGVTVEAEFEVGEYQIVLLSAKDSSGLETWLGQEGYKIPAGAAGHLKPYVEEGSKFFVAKVDIAKVKKDSDGRTVLSPLRFHYDTEDFKLPVRLGLMNAKGKQDLIVHIIARGQRYQTANYKNAFIPTNLDLKDSARGNFAEFYAALFDATLEKNPGAVITEYAWDAGSCDPCPTPALNYSELMTLGLDVLNQAPKTAANPLAPTRTTGTTGAKKKMKRPPGGGAQAKPRIRPRRPPRRRPRRSFRGFVLTRLHVRYSAAELKDDLVFTKAGPIFGGREVRNGPNGGLEEGAKPSGMNNFQARYAIRHEWTGPIECESPVRGRWGGPPNGSRPNPAAATKLAFAPRGKLKLASVVASDVPELGVIAAAGAGAVEAKPEPPLATEDKPTPGKSEEPAKDGKKESKGCSAAGGGGLGSLFLLFGLGAILGRVRRSRHGRRS